MSRVHIVTAAALAGVILASDPILGGGLAVYRQYPIGSTVSEVLALGQIQESKVRTIHDRPAVIREAQWRPLYRITETRDAVRDVRFRFYNDRLYQVLVTYDPARMEGLTNNDVAESISAVYGTPLLSDSRNVPDLTQEGLSRDLTIVAQWGDGDVVLTLSSGPYAQFQLELISKTLHTQARAAITEAVRLDALEAPQRDEARRAKEGAAATAVKENARTVNKAAFRP